MAGGNAGFWTLLLATGLGAGGAALAAEVVVIETVGTELFDVEVYKENASVIWELA